MATIDGCDLVPDAVERLNERFGDSGHVRPAALGDPAGTNLPTDRQYPLVTILNVLLHVTDDDRFERGAARRWPRSSSPAARC